MAKYQQYAEYKDSGVEWLGEIPSHWEVVRLKYIAELSGNKISNSESQYVGLENVESKTGKFKVTEGIVSEGVSNTFEKDNLLFGKLRPYLAKSWLANFSGICSSEFLVLDSKLVHPKFLKYMTLTDEFVEQVNSSTYGTKMPRASWDFIGLLPLPVMDYSLSETIANFLDHETAQIDTLIEKQQTLIQLLKEKRQAVISHAVTKGLNPDAPMKESGVEWLGGIPNHWQMKKLKYVGEAKNGLTYSPDDVTEAGLGTLVLRSSNIQNTRLAFEDNVYVDMKVPERSLVRKDDILICSRNGSRRLIGKNALITEDIAGQAFGAFMVVFRSDINVYLYWILNSPLFEYQSGSFLTSTINQLTIGNLNSMEVPIPPKEEQVKIIKYLEVEMNIFDNLISKAEQAIQLMQERRTALISAAVTGKIDVRGWVAPE